jgi:hypothetical protein
LLSSISLFTKKENVGKRGNAKGTTVEQKRKNGIWTMENVPNSNNLETKSGKELYSGVLSCIIRVKCRRRLFGKQPGKKPFIYTDRRMQSG